MGLGLAQRRGGGDLITGGDSAGEVFAEYTPLGAFNLVNSLIFPSAREVHTLLHLLRCWPTIGVLLLSSYWHLKLRNPLKKVNNEVQIEQDAW